LGDNPGKLSPARRPALSEFPMIAFRCSQCGLGLQTEDRFAGQRACCPTCKSVEVVPSVPATRVTKPPQQMDGPASSLARAGLVGGSGSEPGKQGPRGSSGS